MSCVSRSGQLWIDLEENAVAPAQEVLYTGSVGLGACAHVRSGGPVKTTFAA